MFTNWLTSTTAVAAAAAAATVTVNSHNNNNQNSENNHNNRTSDLVNSNLTMSTPPDIILEVGLAPSTVRFVAHSLILGMHSGYLRSAIRLDENALVHHHGHHPHHHQHHHGLIGGDLVLYLSNVTAEQFAPLLTYMYTGYLDLNVDNIFGVLLATHVLHMPRALEICRNFLARTQAEGYMASNLTHSSNNSTVTTTAAALTTTTINNNKIIRPIPSKPTIPSFAFMPITTAAAATMATQQQQQQQQLLLPSAALAAYKNIQTQQQQMQQETAALRASEALLNYESNDDVDIERQSAKANNKSDQDDEDEEVEVFIDSNSDTDNEVETENECNISVCSTSSRYSKESKILKVQHAKNTDSDELKNKAKIPKTIRMRTATNTTPATKLKATTNSTTISPTSKSNHKRRDKRNKPQQRQRSSSSGLQVAKAPIPASQLDGIISDTVPAAPKFIIDVASCDGPVRFRRILNTAYGHKPDKLSAQISTERTQQSVSLSFHQQMAKTISQQRQLQQSEESENSESSHGCGGAATATGAAATASVNTKQANQCKTTNASSEVYICVYCKHTFKSQYCYQKHAKRHLNPLNLKSANNATDDIQPNNAVCTTAQAAAHALPMTLTMPMPLPMQLPLPIVTNKQHAAELLRREVRPLDMNVQYYPCKTCGSKFPSYYFVHKHRKMCHADEEPAQPVERNETTTVVQQHDQLNATVADAQENQAENPNANEKAKAKVEDQIEEEADKDQNEHEHEHVNRNDNENGNEDKSGEGRDALND